MVAAPGTAATALSGIVTIACRWEYECDLSSDIPQSKHEFRSTSTANQEYFAEEISCPSVRMLERWHARSPAHPDAGVESHYRGNESRRHFRILERNQVRCLFAYRPVAALPAATASFRSRFPRR